ncbi:MAG: C-GCAxxG-C-C family protein, partial [Spirochaetaceae bacterium]|nr:C-GCAxxG-C-C family protein [Spirochaetaceae bacterium]
MEKSFSLKKTREDAERMFREGGFYCSEAVVASIRANIAPEMPATLVAAASGFPAGVGGSLCLCGAVSGGVIALGYFFGRTGPSSAEDPKSVNSM